MLILASLLSEGADALVNPLVAVDLGTTLGELLLLLRLMMMTMTGSSSAPGLGTAAVTGTMAMVLTGRSMHGTVQIAQGTAAISHGWSWTLTVGVEKPQGQGLLLLRVQGRSCGVRAAGRG